MIKVIIDDIECDLHEDNQVKLSYNGDDMVNLESGRAGTTISLKMASSSVNDVVFGAGSDVHTPTKFNSQWHPISIDVDGITLLSGTAYLMEVVWSTEERYYTVECRGGVLQWASNASGTQFKNIDISYTISLNEEQIKASWSSDKAVKFFPIVRDSYTVEGTEIDPYGVRLLRSIDDYHPFVNIWSAIKAIFTASGYSVESQSCTDESFENLYVSGNYSSEENSAARSAMGFYAKREADVTTSTDLSGRVAMSPYESVCSVGNIVDLSTTINQSECYNYGNVLQINGEALEFVPTTQISAGFEYYLHYSCDTKIESRTKLTGVDSLTTISHGDIKWEITNRYFDHRDSPSTEIDYKVIIFDFVEGEKYRLYSYDASGITIEQFNIDERMMELRLSETPYRLELKKFVNIGYTACDADWALYYAYIDEIGQTEIKITVRCSPDEFTPTSPMRFELQLLYGGLPSSSFTLYSDTSVRPYFSAYPGYNASVSFSDIAQIDYSALEFLSAMQHLYNLRFCTVEDEKKVIIESFDNFYNGELRDWSDKLLLSEEVEFVDLAHSAHRTTTLGYQQTDGVVNRMGESDNQYFGEWSYEVDSYAASSTNDTQLNPIFSASTNDDDLVLVVGDRDDVTTVDSLNFSPRIVKYLGMNEDIAGENYSLPYISFHSPDNNFTLCFENRDGVEGLNRNYQSYVDLLQRSHLITLSLSLTALEYTNLFSHDGQSASVRDIFYFEIFGESFRTILKSIESYDALSGVARCSFLTID